MNEAASIPLPWGAGDIGTLAVALPVFFFAAFKHRRSLMRKDIKLDDAYASLMGSALTVGPLLMIILDPINKTFHVLNMDLLRIVMNEARITLWLAAFIALINTWLALLRTRDA